jgi:drug/metabolite transporter (DMT)-like permease
MLQKLKIKENLEIFFLFSLFILCDTATQIFLKKGATNLGEIPLDQISHIFIYVLSILSNINIMMGILFVLIAFFSWLAILSKVDLSKAQLMNALVYVTVPLASIFFLGETIQMTQMFGILLISLGALIASA